MTTARQFLDLIHQYERFKAATNNPEHAVKGLTDSELTLLLQVSAETFNTLRREAIRRNIWDGLVKVGLNMKKSQLTP